MIVVQAGLRQIFLSHHCRCYMFTVVVFLFSLEIMQNHSFVTEFVLLGVSQSPDVQKTIFVVILFIYIATNQGELANCGDHQ